MESEQPVFLLQGAFQRLRELQAILAKSEIPTQIVQPPGGNANA